MLGCSCQTQTHLVMLRVREWAPKGHLRQPLHPRCSSQCAMEEREGWGEEEGRVLRVKGLEIRVHLTLGGIPVQGQSVLLSTQPFLLLQRTI